MLIVPKETLIQSYKNVINKRLLDYDLIIVKLQALVTTGDLTEDDVQPLVNMINPGEFQRVM